MCPIAVHIVSFLSPFGEALISVGEIAVGSALGFILGIVAFHYQHKRTKDVEKADSQKAAYDAVDRLAQSAALNIEAVAIVKNLHGPELGEESERISVLKDRFFAADAQNKERLLLEIKNTLSSLENFFIFTPMITNSAFPASDQYTIALRKSPTLSLLSSRSDSIINHLNDYINKRNSYIYDYAKSGGLNMNPDQIIFYISILSDSGVAISHLFDDSLAMLKLLFDQAEKYLDTSSPGPRSHRYNIAPNALRALPPTGRFQTLEEQIDAINN